MQPESTLGLIFLFLAVVVMAPIGNSFPWFFTKVSRGILERYYQSVLVTSLFLQ